jgi:cell division protein ZapA (FtsZ GTPase activity inhibitor)
VHPEEKIPVRVQIGGKLMPLKVARKDEEIIRMAARMLNKRLEDFKSFDAEDENVRLAWAALDYTGDLLRMKREEQSAVDDIEQQLSDLETLLQRF